MVLVHRALGCRFSIYLHDHLPPHVHVDGNGSTAKVRLDGDGRPEVMWQIGFGRLEIRRIVKVVESERERLRKEWDLIHG